MDPTPASLPVAADWFSLTWVTGSVAMLTEPHVDGLIRANLWFVRGRERDLLVDTGNGIAPLRRVLERLAHGRRHDMVAVATHAHIDHIGGLHEFGHRLFHKDEQAHAATIDRFPPLTPMGWPDDLREQLADSGFVPPDLLIDAAPDAAFDPAAFRICPVAATRHLEGGDLLDLGDRQLLVLHLPGHTPGSIGLWDEANAALFSGDAIYDGGLIDTLPESDAAAYVHTMERLRDLPAEVVYPGHGEPFGRDTLRRLAESYLRRR
jgi:glyoxylase-like metal-dependent hydrolase (beta-lactamase superfamily II)